MDICVFGYALECDNCFTGTWNHRYADLEYTLVMSIENN